MTLRLSQMVRCLVQVCIRKTSGKSSSNCRQNCSAKAEQKFGTLLPGSSVKRMVIESFLGMEIKNVNIMLRLV